jgi:hypothetical protein
MKLIIGLLNNSNLHAIISTSLMINLHWVKKIYFAVLEELYNSFVPHWLAVLISRNNSITRQNLFFFTKNASNQRSSLSVYRPRNGSEAFLRKTAGPEYKRRLLWSNRITAQARRSKTEPAGLSNQTSDCYLPGKNKNQLKYRQMGA